MVRPSEFILDGIVFYNSESTPVSSSIKTVCMHTSKRLAFSPIYYVFFFLILQFFWQPIREGNFIIQPKVDFDISASTVAGLLKLGLLPLFLPRLPSLSLYALIICSLFSFQIPSSSIHRSLGLDLSGRKGYCFLDIY